jgi:hypothetical protein
MSFWMEKAPQEEFPSALHTALSELKLDTCIAYKTSYLQWRSDMYDLL